MTDTATPKMTHRQVLEALSGLLLGMFVSMLASTVVSTSLPVIVSDLKGDQTTFTWVITATLLTTAISTPIWGKLADLTNRKVLFQLALLLFIVASASAGFAANPEMLITSRALQGLGAGGLAALSQIILADIISPRERGRYMGLFGAVMAVATVGGPLLGGFITDTFDWRWNFFIAVPFAIAAMILVQATLKLPHREARKVRIDYLGIVLLSAAVSLLLIWITSAGRDFEWMSWTTLWMTGGAVLAILLFIINELVVAEPLIPLSMFRGRTFTLAVVASIATGIALFGVSVYLSQYMQMSRGATPTEAGLLTLPMIGGLLLSSIIVGQIITRTGKWKVWMILGSAMLLTGLILLSTIHYDTSFWLLSVFMLLTGAGVGMTMQNLVLVVQNTAKPTEIGAASSGVTFFRTLGGTVGVSVMGAALANSLTSLMTDSALRIQEAIIKSGAAGVKAAESLKAGTLPRVHEFPDALRQVVEDLYAQSIAHAFLIAIPLAVVSLIAILFLPNVSLNRQTTAERLANDEAMVVADVTGAIPVVGSQDVREQPVPATRAERKAAE